MGFVRSLFNFGKPKNPLNDQPSDQFEQSSSKSKVFDKKEGEYVDYEEVE